MSFSSIDVSWKPADNSLAEILANFNCMSSQTVQQRIDARNLEMKLATMDETLGDSNGPPKQLLLYLIRMGSFTSTPKILNGDIQDNDINFPNNISRHELLQYCQKNSTSHRMLKRKFRRTDDSTDMEYGFKLKKLNGVSEVCSDYVTNPRNIRVLQWNILSQALGVMNDNFVKCPLDALEWCSRRYQIIEEFMEYCPDVICLQEVDHFNFLKNALSCQGYSGVFFPKPNSPCYYINNNNGPDGCAIFYRSDKFELLQSESRVLEIWSIQSNQVALLTNLRIIETGEEISLATTHLKARNGTLLSTMRNEQCKDLLHFVKGHAGDRPLILCGDFNAEPTEPTYHTVLLNQSNFGSAYADCSRSNLPSHLREPPYTTWKIREEGEVCHTIDYIFYSGDRLEVEAVLEMPTGDEIGAERVPSYMYPSDHFSLVCDFRLKNVGSQL